MVDIDATQLAQGYAAWAESGDQSMLGLFSSDFHDHASGMTGLEIFDVVGGWFAESFADRHVEVHAVMQEGDRVMVWLTLTGRHVGNAFPRLKGRPIRGVDVTWPQVHFFRVADGLAVEHWAVRDDARLLDPIGG